MKRIFVLLLFSWIATSVSAQEIAGQWTGTLKLPTTDLKLVFNVIHSGEKYRATFDSPNQGAKNIPIETTCYENGELIFHIPQIRAEYSGRLNEQGVVEGIFRQSGQEFPMALKRVVYIPVPGEYDFDGQWMGTVEIQGIKLRVVFHVSRIGNEYASAMDSPDQGAKGTPVRVTRVNGHEIMLEIPAISFIYRGEADREGKIMGRLTQFGVEYTLNLERQNEIVKLDRPQEPKAPFPYRIEEVVFENEADSVMLAGTLTLPEGKDNFPVAVMISGSGPQNRNEEMLGHKPFWVIADYLARRGIGVLRFDDRGVGKSTGVFAKATSLDFARDAASAVRYLKEKRKFREIGLIGHSEGGMIAPLVASESKDVKFIVLLAGTGIRGDQVLLTQQAAIHREAGIADSVVQEIEHWHRGIYDMILASSSVDEVRDSVSTYFRNLLEAASPGAFGGMKSEDIIRARVDQLLHPWMYFFMRYDPVPALKKVKCPVLALNGDKDLQVLPEINLDGIRRGLVAAKNRNVTIKVLPGLNHLFQECESGAPALYGSISQTFSPVALKEIGDWIENLKIKK